MEIVLYTYEPLHGYEFSPTTLALAVEYFTYDMSEDELNNQYTTYLSSFETSTELPLP